MHHGNIAPTTLAVSLHGVIAIAYGVFLTRCSLAIGFRKAGFKDSNALTFKIRHTAAPSYLSRHIKPRSRSGTRSSAIPFSRSAVQTNQYRKTILQLRSACNLELSASCYHYCDTLSAFKSRLKHLFNTCSPSAAPLALRHHGTLQMHYYYY